MNTAEVCGLYGAGLMLGAGFLAAIWNGVIIITFSVGVKVVPPWSRHAPPAKKPAAVAAATDSAAGEADSAPSPAAVPGRRAA